MKRLIECFWYRGALRRVPRRKGPINNPTGPTSFFGLLVNPSALWLGAHYSPGHKRWCINLLPCVTLWWTKPGGQLP